ncbi:MAG: shikimate dehydrogenase [Cyanophyceae cyanobacterium]
MTITGKTRLLGVIGDPIKHSLSPTMHNRAIAQLGLDWVYVAFPIAPENLETALNGFAAIDLVGFNVTIPHKQAIMPLLTEISDQAKAVGAVNTVWRSPQGWRGTNTDVDGFMAPLKLMRGWSGTTAIVLGCGGSARAVIAACRLLGCKSVKVVARNADKLAEFCKSFQAPNPLAIALEPIPWSELSENLTGADLVVNTTPIGMHPNENAAPLNEAQLAQLPESAVVYDIIYTPRPTLLLKHAADRGLKTLDGLEMLVQQGAIALEKWSGKSAPVDVMRQALLDWFDGKG